MGADGWWPWRSSGQSPGDRPEARLMPAPPTIFSDQPPQSEKRCLQAQLVARTLEKRWERRLEAGSWAQPTHDAARLPGNFIPRAGWKPALPAQGQRRLQCWGSAARRRDRSGWRRGGCRRGPGFALPRVLPPVTPPERAPLRWNTPPDVCSLFAQRATPWIDKLPIDPVTFMESTAYRNQDPRQ